MARGEKVGKARGMPIRAMLVPRYVRRAALRWNEDLAALRPLAEPSGPDAERLKAHSTR